VLIYATTKLHQRRYVVIFLSVYLILLLINLFYYWWPYFIVCDICRTIRACVCLLLLFMDIFGCLCLADKTWASTSVLVLCGHEWVLRYWSFVDISEKWWLMWSIFCRYTNSLKTIETCVESASATVCVQYAIAGCFILFWWGRLGRVALHQVT
jgi:hypothetical protein